MTVKDLHKKAMDFNDKALIAVSKGRTAKSYYKKAYEWEKKAYLLFASASDVEPTRSVLLRSAASLAFMAELYEEAEKMIAIGLAGNPPEEIKEELRLLNYQNFNALSLKNKPNIEEKDSKNISIFISYEKGFRLKLINEVEKFITSYSKNNSFQFHFINPENIEKKRVKVGSIGISDRDRALHGKATALINKSVSNNGTNSKLKLNIEPFSSRFSPKPKESASDKKRR